MLYSYYKPIDFLSNFVDRFWHYEGYKAKHLTERILPLGTIELVINLQQDELRIYDVTNPESCKRLSGSVVSGAYDRGFISDTEEEAFIMGVHFRPGGAFPFLDVPVDELANKHIDLEALWGPTAIQMRDRLCEAQSPAKRFQLLHEALTNHLFRRPESHYAVSAALNIFASAYPNSTIRDVAKYVGLSQRRFIQVFKSEVGMKPKLFSRIQRFNRTRAFLEENTVLDWVALSVDQGYFDQSHMIREFNEFSGLSPAHFISNQNRLRFDGAHIKHNHLPNI